MSTKNSNKTQQTYGLFTMITMIVGIVIGAGIYFRTADIIRYANGNLMIGMLVLALGSLCIVFGSLALAELARRHVGAGGVIAYFDRFVSRKMAAGFGWFQMMVWFPTIAVVVGWAAAMYTFMLLGIKAPFWQEVLLGLVYNAWFAFMNYFSRKLGGLMQQVSTLIKMIPLLLIAVYGVFFTPVSQGVVQSVHAFPAEFSKFGWLTALLPLAFSYDGWTISLSIANEVENPKKNMVRALVIGPLIILSVYLLYFYGMFNMMGSEQLLALGDQAIFVVMQQFFGPKMAQIMLLIVVISMMGVLNGVNLSFIRIPQALAEQDMLPDYGFSKLNPNTQTSLYSTFFVLGLEAFWSLAHFIVMTFNLFNGRDVSEISIVLCYLSYVILYVVVYRIYLQERQYQKLIIPVLATAGSLMILIGSLLAGPFYVTLFLVICSTVIVAGYRYYEYQTLKNI